MTRTRNAVVSWFLIAAVACAFSASSSPVEAKKKKAGAEKGLEYSAVILPPAGANNITPSEITIKISRFNTPEEKAALKATLESKGQLATLTQAQGSTVGRLIRAGGRGVDILFAAQQETPDGTRIAIVTERFPLHPGTIMNADTADLPFGLAWFYPQADGKGKGQIFGATALSLGADGEVDISAYKASGGILENVKAR